MKIKKWILFLIAISLTLSLFGETVPTDNKGFYGKEKLESLDAIGAIKLNGTEVTNDLHITGTLISRDAKIGFLDILGEANLTETIVLNGGTVMGLIQAVRSTFKKPITILSQRAVFTSSKLEGITVKQDSAYKGKQVIELRQGTIVHGPIHFESGKGEVIIFSRSRIDGIVSGAKIIKK